jgi:hypothetical protein
MRLARRLLIAVTVALVSLTALSPRKARADEVTNLSRTLLHSKQHKERIGAAVTLGRLEDKRALSALVKALDDQHHNVRALAAVALGRIGHASALPALEKALKDREEVVRRRAREAIEAIQKKGLSGAATGPAAGKGASPGRPGPSTRGYKVSAGKGDPGFGRNPRKRVRPQVYVSLQSAADKSTGRAKPQTRNQRAEQMKKLLAQELEATPEITTDVRVARKLRIVEYNLDASITRFTRRVQGGFMEIECEIHVAISDGRGKILSFMTGGAKVQVPRRSFKKQYLERLHLEALENAVKGVHQDLLAHLRPRKPG